jgi:hypothetical protein
MLKTRIVIKQNKNRQLCDKIDLELETEKADLEIETEGAD